MLETGLGKSVIRSENMNDEATRLRARGGVVAKILDILRGCPMAAVLLLGFLLLGGPVLSSADDSDGDLRLVETDSLDTVSTDYSGRPQIFDDEDGDGTGEWKGICDDGLEDSRYATEEAEVICRQLGYLGGATTSEYIHGTPPASVQRNVPGMELSDLECAGSERKLLDCRHGGRGVHICFNQEYFHVECDEPDSSANSTAAGLMTITGEYEVGQTLTADVSDIEDDNEIPTDVTFSYEWVRVNHLINNLNNESDISDATNSTYVIGREDFGKKIKVKASFKDSADNPENIQSHPGDEVTLGSSPSEEDTDYFDGHLRLVGGANEKIGRFEIYDSTDMEWKGICDDGWGNFEADVACIQMGFSVGAKRPIIGLSPSTTTTGPTDFLLDDVDCNRTEDELFECSHSGRGVHDCNIAFEHAGAQCR
jgi:deleted-in-malignant-brain-tumors protein 1